ncbi:MULTISPECIES: ATP-binding protein [unclassified Bradyrhizobium]|uniref:ATP-binding protein n=1 Tax=unclassified Bradyrhizobium TaxID=2631580 RepID=UPI001BA90F93|nr:MULTISPECIES: ATP-binding protein [unclassified Bradyrhizobium]MBR1225564.1 HAMP domain-containing protein [Bradyrhizobium sp. AUGA SZCCT0176]MBR1232183.1 HAMP domain-containing protein [Bradyrhizobium sp. AUGA SZCCT0182]MBR1298075.1 HAMP domain-containing protein [Bradyrhizobium sp. AUGA SZCCT0042]
MSARFRRTAARLWPDSLFRRLAIILFGGLLATHVLSFGLVAFNVFGLSREIGDDYFIRYIATTVAILDRVKTEERSAWLERLSRPTYRYVLGGGGEIEAAPSKRRQERLARLRAMLGAGHDAKSIFYLDPLNRRRLGWLVHLKDGSPLMVEFVAQRTVISPWLPTAFAVQLFALAFLTWIAVKLATQPLVRLERAANSLGSDLRGELLPEDGPKEVARAATAFNAMQRRIAGQAVERIQILAGIARRLQTPITRMRLRADFLGDSDAKERLQGDLQEMQTLVKQGLALARGRDELSKQRCQTDLHALIDSLVCDYSDAGKSLRFSGERGVTILTHPQALRRIMINLIDNGLKFGEDVEVAIDAQRSNGITITVSDRGPGIPDEHLKSVFLPFYRVEASRNRETGGTGLGLAIAQQLTSALLGTLTLANRDGGGLEARLEFLR